MAKRIRNNQGTPVTPSTERPRIPISTFPILTENIAFVVPALELQVLMSKLMSPLTALMKTLEAEYGSDFEQIVEKINEIAQDGPLELYLTGLQVNFNDEIEIHQVYYLKNTDKFFTFQASDNPDILSSLDDTHKHAIIQHQPSTLDPDPNPETETETETTSFSVGQFDGLQFDHHNLDFFNDHPDGPVSFVYFAINQIKPLIARTAQTEGRIFFSGSRIDLGRKLSSDGTNSQYDGLYFSLKMEGEFNMPNVRVETTPPPGIAVSVPCPPEWFFESSLLEAAQEVNPTAEIIPRLINGQIPVSISLTSISISTDQVNDIQG
jgi:hypothetical protein